MQALFYAYSLSYFFLLIGSYDYSDRFHQVNNVVFLLLNIAILIGSFIGFGALSSSLCAKSGFGMVLWYLNGLAVVMCLVELAIAHWFFFAFKSTGKFPLDDDYARHN